MIPKTCPLNNKWKLLATLNFKCDFWHVVKGGECDDCPLYKAIKGDIVDTKEVWVKRKGKLIRVALP